MSTEELSNSLCETLAVFDGGGEPLTTNEVTDSLDVSRRSTYARLQRLAERDRLRTKKVGARGRIWWQPTEAPDGGDGTPDGDGYHEDGDSDQFQSLIDAVEEYAIFRLDPEGRVVSWNGGAERIKGYDREEIVGEHFSTFYTDDDVDDGVPEWNLATAAEEGVVEDEGWRVRADGTTFWANVTITAIRGDDGDLEGFAKVTRDMTERREYEQRLRQERDVVERVIETAPAGIVVVDLDGEVVRANAQSMDQFGFDSTDGGYNLGDAVVYDEDGEWVPPEERPYARVIETGEPVTDWVCRVDSPEHGVRWLSVNAVPLGDGDGVERVLATAQDVTRLKSQAKQLERQRDDLRGELTEMFERIDAAFFALDDDWRFTYVNERAEEVLECSAGELLGDSVWEAFPGAVGTTFEEQYRRAMASQEPVTFEAEYPALSAWFEVRAYPSESGISVYFHDVTERKEREAELERYEVLFTESRDVNAVLDPDGTFRHVTPSSAAVLGYDPDELVGENAFEFVHPEDRERVVEEFAGLVDDPEREPTVDYRFRHADGSWVVLESRGRNLLDDHTIEGIVVYTRDVTERTAREDELELYETIVETVQDGVYVLDDEFNFTRVNEAYCEMTGYDREELLGEHCTLVIDETVSQESAEHVQQIAAGESDAVTIEADLHRADGSSLPAESNFTALPEATSAEHQKVGVVRDVSERKARERELERYETIVESLWDGVYALDDDERFVLVNDAFCELTGYDREELIGAPSTLVTPEFIGETAAEQAEAVLAGEREVGVVEFPLERKDGGVVPVETRFGPYEYVEGTNARAGVTRDVTERKRFEEALTALNAASRELFDATTAEAVGAVVVETVEEVLDLPGVLVYGHDADRDRLVPLAESVESEYMREELPAVPVGDGSITGHVFAQGTSRYYEDVTESPRLEAAASDTAIRAGSFVPLGDHGILVAGTTEVDGLDQDVRQLLALLAATAEAALDRVEREAELRTRIRQQAVVTDLGQRALESHDVDALMAEATELVADTLGNDYCKVLDLDQAAEELLLRQGVGWHDGIVGEATVSAVEDDSQAAYTLATDEPVVVEDLATESRFSGPDLLTDHDVRSGVSTVIGPPDDPWGILSTHDTATRSFSEQDVNFVQSVANILANAISRHEDERALRQQREQLAALNGLNQVIRETTEAVIEQSTREEIEETVCERLAATDSYEFAWIGDVDLATQTVQPRTEAGVDGYLDGVTVSVDPEDEHSDGPTGRAFRTGQMQTSQDVLADANFGPWRDHVGSYGFRSSAAIPIVHDDTTYGVLNVYAERPHAFEGQERTVVRQLGEVVGHAIAAVDRKRALMSDEVVELEFRIQNAFDALDAGGSSDGTVTLDDTVPLSEEEFLVYGTATPDAVGTVEALVDVLPHWKSVTFRDADDGDDVSFELHLSGPPVLSTVASVGGTVEEAVMADGDFRMTLQLSPTVEVRTVLDAVQDAYPDAEMVARRQTSRVDDSSERTRSVLAEELTDRQRTALEVAFHAGFFEWPRETSGEDVADSLGVSSPTFHQHLRKAERKVFDALLA